MTLRDYSQGCYRMRGVGRGQTLHLLLVEEVMQVVLICVLCLLILLYWQLIQEVTPRYPASASDSELPSLPLAKFESWRQSPTLKRTFSSQRPLLEKTYSTGGSAAVSKKLNVSAMVKKKFFLSCCLCLT